MNASMLYFRQLLAGRDFALLSPAAGQMANFVYLVGDREIGECVLIDPAWDIRGLLSLALEDGMKVVGAVATHGHPDHVGGNLFGFAIEGAAKLVEVARVKVWVHEADVGQLKHHTGLKDEELVIVRGDEKLVVGTTEIGFIHTPGHTPGSMCLRVGDGIITGDTLFVGACGRVDLPGSSPEQMWASLTQKLAVLPDEVVIYPGHHYGSARTSTVGDEQRTNPFLKARPFTEWRSLEEV
jgi:hydroxyacylglutathione hydrolase